MSTISRRSAAVGVASLAAIGALFAAAVPASAAPAAAQSCAVNLQTHATACGASESQAKQLAAVPAASVLAVRLYDGYNYTGTSWDYYVPKACTAGYEGEYGLADLGPASNKASSVHTYNHCDVHLHDPLNYGNPHSVWIDQAPDLRTIGDGWNNRASSIGIS
jgi:hypothetical protein